MELSAGFFNNVFGDDGANFDELAIAAIDRTQQAFECCSVGTHAGVCVAGALSRVALTSGVGHGVDHPSLYIPLLGSENVGFASGQPQNKM